MGKKGKSLRQNCFEMLCGQEEIWKVIEKAIFSMIEDLLKHPHDVGVWERAVLGYRHCWTFWQNQCSKLMQNWFRYLGKMCSRR